MVFKSAFKNQLTYMMAQNFSEPILCMRIKLKLEFVSYKCNECHFTNGLLQWLIPLTPIASRHTAYL